MPDITKDISNVKFYRNVKRYLTGFDVLRVKRRLVELGYLGSANTNKFGNESYAAVVAFQKANGLGDDGIVGKLTWSALFGEGAVEQTESAAGNSENAGFVDYSVLDRFSLKIQTALKTDLDKVSDLRRAVCLDALQFAINPFDPPKHPCAFYIRGGNLYDPDMSLHVMTEKRFSTYLAITKWAEFYDGGRAEMMLAAASAAGWTLPGSDCSGFIVGLMRHHQIYDNDKIVGNDNKFDSNANGLFAAYCTVTDDPKPGDWAWKDGHIGLYVGGGYIVECVGGAYGVQLTVAENRKVYNFIDGRIHTFSSWEAIGTPDKY